MWDGMAIQPLRSIPDYRHLVEGVGFSVLSVTDLTEEWRPILKERLAMYQRLRQKRGSPGRPWDTMHFMNPTFGLSTSFNSARSAGSEL